MKKYAGFTLVEIAIVLVIIGLLLGGILKGQELINSARVRNLADMNSGIQAAYYGFIDRYRAVPGDMTSTNAANAIGTAIAGSGNGNGRIDSDTSVAGINTVWQEPNAAWEQMAEAGFIQGSYSGVTTKPTIDGTAAPLNVFNGVVTLGRTNEYQGAASARLHLIIGRNIPVTVMRELDQKVDDGRPRAGVLRLSTIDDDSGVYEEWGSSGADACDTADGADFIYDIPLDAQDCNAVVLY